ncbi:MAG: hypothetical protein BYD32DRAFT_238893 [Podila humilis]|nr:MAG: hypothetical protein BYD32DRAFT_238893 [Podila humilis]
MRTITFLAFLWALMTVLFPAVSTVSAEASVDAESSALEIRGVKKPAGAAYEATLDLLVKEHSDIVLKAFADVCTDANLTTDITTELRVQISGLINVDFGLGTRLSTALRSSIKGTVRGEVDLDIKTQFTANLRTNLAAIVTKRCPKHDAACIRAQSKNIVKDAIKLTTKASAKISDRISTSLATKIRTSIDIQIKKFSINLWLIKIHVTGDVDVSNTVIFRFKAAAGLCAKACADISLKQVADIRAIC